MLNQKEKVCCVSRQGDEVCFIVYAQDTPDVKIRVYDAGEVDARFDGPYCLDAVSVFKQLASDCHPHCVMPVALAKKLFNPAIPFAG